MMSADENDAMIPQRMSQHLDEIAGLAIVGDNDSDRCKRAIGALGERGFRRLDALCAETHDALEDPTSFLGKRARK